MEKQNLIAGLAHWLAQGKLDPQPALLAIQRLAGQPPEISSYLDLLAALEQRPEESFIPVAGAMRETLRLEALRFHERSQRDWPLQDPTPGILAGLPLQPAAPWKLGAPLAPPLATVRRLARDLHALSAPGVQAPRLRQTISRRLAEALAAAQQLLVLQFEHSEEPLQNLIQTRWTGDRPGSDAVLLDPRARWKAVEAGVWTRMSPALREELASLPPGSSRPLVLSALQAIFVEKTDLQHKAEILDVLAAWPNPASFPVLQKLADTPWAQTRVLLDLTLRFGQSDLKTWQDWQTWMDAETRLWQFEQQELQARLAEDGPVILVGLYSQLPGAEPSILHNLTRSVAEMSPPISLPALVGAWAVEIAPEERQALLPDTAPGAVLEAPPIIPTSKAAVALPPRMTVSAEARQQARAAEEVRTPPAPAKPSMWDEHIQPFFVENWYVVAGIAMVILGASLLAYYTWDKHWLVRYTIMPALLGAFTWGLAGVGNWIEKKGAEFKSTAAMLRGAAIGLLPVNFMAMALLSSDPQVPQKAPPLLAMAALYFAAFGFGLRRWCAAVEPAVGNKLGGTLLFLNALVALGPLAQTMLGLQGRPLLLCLGAGFYVGFAVSCATLVWFTRHVLTREMALERRVPWFVGAVLSVTFLQVFVWVHGFIRHVPEASTYALLVIATGWLILHAERRAIELTGGPTWHGGESFLGFACILLGVLMGFTEPWMRIASFIAAGGAWLYQAAPRRHALHYWIALTLWGLGGASVGFLPGFPAPWLPGLGLLIAIGYGLGAWRQSPSQRADLAPACLGMQVVALIVTTVVAPLVQWHYQTEPWVTAGWLVLVAALLGWRSWKEQHIHWLHATALVLALALPYAGFLDLAHRTAHHNTLCFGLALLSLLWLGLVFARPSPLLLQVRSSVLLFYALLALAAMLLRVILGDTSPNAFWYREYMDYLGPILMAAALVPATYHSRSLIPAGVAVALMAVLFPELKSNLQTMRPSWAWGSGLGSSIAALGLVSLCFRLRRARYLAGLTGGDPLFGGELFPLRRYDHTLFTLPLLAAALFLLVKVDSWHLLRGLLQDSFLFKTAIAVGVTGVAWTILAVYCRDRRGAVAGVHLGWFFGLVGMALAYWAKAVRPNWTLPLVGWALLLQSLYFLYRMVLERRYPWSAQLLTCPTRQVLLGSTLVLSVACLAELLFGSTLERLQWLYLFLLAQLAWHGLRTRHAIFGTLLFLQVWAAVLAISAPGPGPLWERVSLASGFTPTLWLFLAVQLAGIVSEQLPVGRQHGAPLLAPPSAITSALGLLLAGLGVADGAFSLALTSPQQWLLLGLVLICARANASGPHLLVGLLLAYVVVHRPLLVGVPEWEGRIAVLSSPWRLSLFGLVLVGLAALGRRMHQAAPGVFLAPEAKRFNAVATLRWMVIPGLAFGVVAALYHTFEPALRGSPAQLAAPYLAAAAFAVAVRSERTLGFLAGAGLLLVLGNTHLVRLVAGDFLRSHGLSELHFSCLGMALTLLQGTLAKRFVPEERVRTAATFGGLALAGGILVLLSANYFTDPDLAGVSVTRFVVSGMLAWLAGLYFRRASESSGREAALAGVCAGLYHFAVVLTLWCVALLVPWLRRPASAFIALGVPALYFLVRAELYHGRGQVGAARYVISAAVLSFVLLGLYGFKGFFHMVLFPGTPIGTEYYHLNAPVVVALGLILLRLRGLGGSEWLALYGGLALMVGSYFLLTAMPGFSPFDFPVPSAWCAVVWGHFWILLSHARSPVRTQIQRLAALKDDSWTALRRTWGYCLLAGTQASMLWGLTDYSANTYLAAPLLAGGASIWIHQGVIRRSALYFWIAAAELLLALHMDFLIPSYLPRLAVIWVLLGIWAGLLLLHDALKLEAKIIRRPILVLLALHLAQVLYHAPWSATALWGVAIAAALAAWTPLATPAGQNAGDRSAAAILPWTPVWLVYFSQGRLQETGPAGAFEPWPVLTAAATCLVTGMVARAAAIRFGMQPGSSANGRVRLFHETLQWLTSSGRQVSQGALWLVSAVVLTVQVSHYQTPFAVREYVLLLLLEGTLVFQWFQQANSGREVRAYYLTQLFLVALYGAVRRQLMLTTGPWNYEYDVWASLVFSAGLTGAKQLGVLQPRSAQISLLTSMCLIPVVALTWVLVHGLGVNMALLVVGLHSVLFAYLGKDERASPYNLVALAGFVAFVLMTFWSKLHLRMVHAYVIPVGFGILVLQELFRERIKPGTANAVRLVTLVAMVGSAAYYALTDPRYPVALNLTLILLCLFVMGVGTLLRLRLYLALGLGGLLVDLASLLYKVLVHMERSARMTVIGSLVLVIGALLVFGAIYYKTNKEALHALAGKWRSRFDGWQ